jgi:hypothetical protein
LTSLDLFTKRIDGSLLTSLHLSELMEIERQVLAIIDIETT